LCRKWAWIMRFPVRISAPPTPVFDANFPMCANTLGKTPERIFVMAAPKAPGFQFADNPLAPERNASGVWGFFLRRHNHCHAQIGSCRAWRKSRSAVAGRDGPANRRVRRRSRRCRPTPV
jgi:hypothetical protein